MTDEYNKDLFIQVLAEIERRPESWRQVTWGAQLGACGTAFCFAGHAVRLSGYTDFVWHHDLLDSVRIDGEERHIGSTARYLLAGDEFAEMSHLFHPNNTLADLYRISAKLLQMDEEVLRKEVQKELEP